MKKENYYQLLYLMSALLVVGFFGRLGGDYYQYNPMSTSAPFYVNILMRALEYLLPAALIFLAGVICKKRYSK